MNRTWWAIAALGLAVGVWGCRKSGAPEASPSMRADAASSTPATPYPAAARFDGWLGRWNGPEGNYLLLSRNGDAYTVKIQSLDGANIYEATPAGDRMQFTRDGTTEYIHAGNGKETGMKWFRAKKNCLIIKPGEGFCRY